MFFFKRKPQITLAEFCQGYYSEFILCSHVPNGALENGEAIIREVAEIDSSFVEMDKDLVAAEYIMLKFELFALAWLHKQGEDRTAELSDFTKQYLENARKLEMWDGLASYSDASALSCYIDKTGKPLSGNTPSGRFAISFFNEHRVNFVKHSIGLGFDKIAVAQAANRVGTNLVSNKQFICAYLMQRFCKRLDCKLNSAAQVCICNILHNHYMQVLSALKSVSIKG